jgi:hypothetical protein
MNGQPERAGWFGKTFTCGGEVQPLVCVDAEGNKFSNKAMGKGECRSQGPSLRLAARSATSVRLAARST